MRSQFQFVFDSGTVITVVVRNRGDALVLLRDILSIPVDFTKSHAKITNLGVFADAQKKVRP